MKEKSSALIWLEKHNPRKGYVTCDIYMTENRQSLVMGMWRGRQNFFSEGRLSYVKCRKTEVTLGRLRIFINADVLLPEDFVIMKVIEFAKELGLYEWAHSLLQRG